MAAIALVIGIIAFVVARIVPEAPPGYDDLHAHLDAWEAPSSLTLVDEREEGQGAPFFGERETVVRVYASPADAGAVCAAVGRSLEGWGEVLFETTPGCGFGGRVAGSDGVGFGIDVRPLGSYTPSESSPAPWYASPGIATVVEIEVRT